MSELVYTKIIKYLNLVVCELHIYIYFFYTGSLNLYIKYFFASSQRRKVTYLQVNSSTKNDSLECLRVTPFASFHSLSNFSFATLLEQPTYENEMRHWKAREQNKKITLEYARLHYTRSSLYNSELKLPVRSECELSNANWDWSIQVWVIRPDLNECSQFLKANRCINVVSEICMSKFGIGLNVSNQSNNISPNTWQEQICKQTMKAIFIQWWRYIPILSWQFLLNSFQARQRMYII